MPAHGLSILLLSGVAASAQISLVPIEGQRAAAAENLFERADAEPAMKCTFKPSAPILNFSLGYEAGYSMELPARGPNHWIIDTLVRLELENTQEIPMYMASRSVLPPALKEQEVIGASFPLSPGSWRIEALAVDDDGRVCHANWRAEIRDSAPVSANPQRKLRRITFLVDSGPIYLASGQFSPLNVETLTGSLSALLRSLPAESARVVVFNLDREKESFRSERFQPAELDQATRAITGAEGGTVDYAKLRRPLSASEFLAGLINRELRETDPSDVLVFMGAAGQRFRGPRQLIAADGSRTLFFYIQYAAPRYAGGSVPAAPTGQICNDGDTGRSCVVAPRHAFDPRLRLAPAAVRDTISDAVAMLGGQTIAVSTPIEFAKALARITDGASRHAKVSKP
jgi:hypothetical protein